MYVRREEMDVIELGKLLLATNGYIYILTQAVCMLSEKLIGLAIPKLY